MKKCNTAAPQITRRTPLIGCLAALGMAFTLALPRAADAGSVTPPAVPAGIEVTAPNTEAFLVGHAIGTQNYVCLPSPSIDHVAWTLFTPQATLFSDNGGQLLTHYFSPNPIENNIVRATWQDSLDTSTVWGKVIAPSSDPVFVAPGAIPWLLIEVVGRRPGPNAGKTVSRMTNFIQRVNTSGGAAPSTGCSLSTDIGNKEFVPYTADYFFYRLTSN